MVTVIIPAYNCEKYLAEAVKSVQTQTCKDWKIIIIDDRSTDNTKEIADRLAAEDNRIAVLQNEVNSGVSSTRNRGVQETDTEWIAFLDSDDTWEKDKLKKQLAILDSYPDVKLIFTGSGFMNESGERLDYVLHVPEKINRRELLKQNLISCSSVLVKRDLLLKYPMPDKKLMHEDFTVWLRILGDESFAYGIDEPLMIYRRSAGSKSSNKFKAARMNWNAYREVGLDFVSACYNMIWYTVRGLRKYSHL